jgi:hypothetical protein
VVQHLALFIRRASFPLDLEWMEGGMLLHARRLLDGQPLYAPPSLDFIPYLYTPLYPALLALLSKLLPFGYLLGGVFPLPRSPARWRCWWWWRPGRVDRRSPPAAGRRGGTAGWACPPPSGLPPAGLVAGSFAFTGSFYDLVRADSLLLLLEAAALTAALLGGGWAARPPRPADRPGVLHQADRLPAGRVHRRGPAGRGWRRGLVYGGGRGGPGRRAAAAQHPFGRLVLAYVFEAAPEPRLQRPPGLRRDAAAPLAPVPLAVRGAGVAVALWRCRVGCTGAMPST